MVHPGSGENWTLSITDSKGQPVRANLLALLYDRSLDAFAPHSLNFSNICFSRVLPYARYRWRDSGTAWYGRTLFGYIGYNALSTEDRTATRWDDTLFENPWNTTFYGYSSGRAAGNRLMAKTAVSTIAHTGAQKEMAMDKVATVPEVAEDEMVQESVTAERGAATEQSLRSNFQETAFFLPRLRTDKDGTASLSFTLPESMTSWRFLALAHDRTMNFGSLDTLVTARKDLMIEAAAPRFVRPGDECEIPVRVTNLTDRTLTTEISLILSETLGEQAVLFDERQTQTLAAGESRTLFYLYKVATDTPALTLRAFGTTSAFSDGEERLIPVLPAEEEIVRTLPFSLDKPSTTTLRIDTLFAREGRNRSLTVELASRPAWIAVTALPALSGKERATSATELAESYYAFALGEATARLRPEIKYLAEQPSDEALRLTSLKTESLTDLTPWLRSARKEAERGEELRRLFDSEIAAARRHTALDRLAALQGSDGSWSWYPGMAGNSYITLEVATLLARVQKLAAEKEVDRLFLPALDFLKKHFQKDVSEMKRTEKRTKVKMRPSETQLRYLYLRTLLGLRPDEDARFIMDRMKASRHDFDLYHKALSAIILAEGGEEAEARLTIKSLMEYSVSREGAGRWFDSPRAEMSRNAYRIPTQCAAIEALEYFGRKAEAREMRLWLMQSKRTQMWETSRETADAVYALLTARDDRGNELSLAAERPVYYTLYKGRKIVALNAESETTTPSTAAYFKQTYRESPATEAETVKIRKTTDGLSWGAIYAAYTIPAEKVKTEGKGLALTVEMEIYDNGKWYPINTETVLRKGDRIRRALTLTADRDYDFVAVEAPHAACFQPAAPFSGYRYEDGLSVYRSLTDSRTDFFIEQVAKGSHRLTEEFFLDRSGIYRSAAMKAECLYAPEYRATAAEEILTITDCR